MRIRLEYIEKKMIEIRDEFDACPAKHIPMPEALIHFLALADSIKAGIEEPKQITLDDVDRMALETLTMTGEIVIREDTPPDPSVGWPGSDTTDGEITGRFEVPVSVASVVAGEPNKHLITIEGDTQPTYDYIRETLMDKIGEYDGIINQVDKKITVDIEITGVHKKGDRAVVEFKVVLK
jgi:hypothetical protein